jgi:hypothetical protein
MLTLGRGFFVPGFDNTGGHKMMSLHELMDAARGVSNMFLAHEIAVDKVATLEHFFSLSGKISLSVSLLQ